MDSTRADEAAQRTVAQLGDLLGEFADQMVLIGGVAVNFWRLPRFTHDVDFTVQADAAVMRGISDRLTGAGYSVKRNQAKDAASGPDFLQFVSTESQPRIVEFQAAKTDFQSTLIARGQRLSTDQVFRVATPEDLIILKLIADRPQDRADCAELAQMPALDWEYVSHWADIWGVTELLGRLREEADRERRRNSDS